MACQKRYKSLLYTLLLHTMKPVCTMLLRFKTKENLLPVWTITFGKIHALYPHFYLKKNLSLKIRISYETLEITNTHTQSINIMISHIRGNWSQKKHCSCYCCHLFQKILVAWLSCWPLSYNTLRQWHTAGMHIVHASFKLMSQSTRACE